MSQRIVQEYMTRQPLTVQRHKTVAAARRLMGEHKIRHLPVVDEAERLVGVVSDRDLQFLETLGTLDPEHAIIDDIMIRDPMHFSPSTPLSEVARAMADAKIGSVVIVEEGKVVGVFTTIDALRALAVLG